MLVGTFADNFDFGQVFFMKDLECPKVLLTAEALESVTVYLFVTMRFDYGTTAMGTESTCFHNPDRI